MKSQEIPLIIPNFNQLVYVINIINWWNYYTNNAPVIIVDNKSTYKPLLAFYRNVNNIWTNVEVIEYRINNCGKNLNNLVRARLNRLYEYYCISNPDIMPHPATPENFLDIFKHCLKNYNFHHVGFGLIINDLPNYITNKKLILSRQSHFFDNKNKFFVNYEGQNFKGFKAPIDLTFSMFKSENGGWEFPYSKAYWQSLRLFSAFHLEWYIHPETNIGEIDYYYKTAMQREQPGKKIKGVNSYRPNEKYEKHAALQRTK